MATRRLALPQLSTREAVLLAFFATFVVVVRAAMRWHLHIPGHSMLAGAMLLVLARACVPRAAAATVVGTLAGLVCMALGMGRGGPLILLKLALPGVAVDLAWPLVSARLPAWLRGAVLGACAGAIHFVPVLIAELLTDVDPAVMLGHALFAAGTKAAFGAVGGAAGLVIAERLRHHGVIAPA